LASGSAPPPEGAPRHNTVPAELVTGTAALVVTVGYSGVPEPEQPYRAWT